MGNTAAVHARHSEPGALRTPQRRAFGYLQLQVCDSRVEFSARHDARKVLPGRAAETLAERRLETARAATTMLLTDSLLTTRRHLPKSGQPPTDFPLSGNSKIGSGLAQNAARRAISQKGAKLPIAYGGIRHDQTGSVAIHRREAIMNNITAVTNARWPTSTPALKKARAKGICPAGSPAALSPPAKPRPCNRPNENATSQGARCANPLRWLSFRTTS